MAVTLSEGKNPYRGQTPFDVLGRLGVGDRRRTRGRGKQFKSRREP